ncbi:hypothetical protein [Celeribacter ethanolicus]|uniref:hypothetical protein n=1 Tax=Celeribacter ethanolicus TaxID=1758178 RepID=UPI000AB93865|nr:hypothetical protein [Celeribacter ethanolicus]
MSVEIEKILERFLTPLPKDAGDGPFLTNIVAEDTPVAKGANSESIETMGADSILADNPLVGRARVISLGLIRVSDTIPPSSFRRVYRLFRVKRQLPEDANKKIWIRFSGNSMAIIAEELENLSPTPKPVTSTVSRPRKTPRPAPPDTRVGEKIEIVDSLINTADAVLTPTQSTRLSSCNIIFRYPEYEPWRLEQGLQNFSSGNENLPNSTKEFNMGNSSGEILEIEIPYPVGQTVPIIFDIVNGNPRQSQQVALTVDVLLAE